MLSLIAVQISSERSRYDSALIQKLMCSQKGTKQQWDTNLILEKQIFVYGETTKITVPCKATTKC